MNKELKTIIENLNGNVLGIGLDEKLINYIEDNNNILECNLLESKIKGKKTCFFARTKTIKIKKIRKVFKKKKVDYIICNYEDIYKYLNTFVKDSIYINKNKLYFYGNVDVELINKKYQRYETVIDVKKYSGNYIVTIDNSKAKNNYFKDLYYRIFDFISNLIIIIGDTLMN